MEVKDALAMYDEYKTYWADVYKEAQVDLDFYLGNQWEPKDVEARKNAGKPTLVVNQLPQYVHQVTNDIRQNVPSVKALPDADGDIDTAEIVNGLFRAIEYQSHADEVCDTAASYAVKCSIGFMGIDHDYCYDDSDEQEIQFKSVPDPLICWLDPASVEYDGRDANGFLMLEPCGRKDFNRLYKGKKFVSFTNPGTEEKKDTINLAHIYVREWGGNRGKKATIRRFKFSGAELLDETTFPGSFIPYVPIYGEVTWVDGKRNVYSLIRQARDPQRRLNHWACKEAEILNMAPVAPVMAEEGTLINGRNEWQSPGTESVLFYKREGLDGQPANKPERLQPPPIPTGVINAMQGCKENIKEAMGLYNASVGQRSNETSGVAIDARKHEGDVATFHFPDNVRRSYGHMGEIALEMMPIIYDTPRIIQILDDESEMKLVAINGAKPTEDQKRAYDLTKGKYRVRITTGASFTTRRQEEAAFLTQVAQKDPNFMQIGGDILFKSMDTPGAQALAARYKKIINPQLLEDSEQPQIPPEVTKKMQQMQQIIEQGAQAIQQLQQQNQQLEQENKSKVVEAQAKAQDSETKAEIDKMKLEVQREENAVKMFELQVKQQELKVQSLQQTQEAMPMVDISPDDPDEVVGAKVGMMRQRKQQQERAMVMMHQQFEQESFDDQQQEELERQEKAAQTQALLEGVNGIQQLLAAQVQAIQQQTAAISMPRHAVYNPDGSIAGVK